MNTCIEVCDFLVLKQGNATKQHKNAEELPRTGT